MARLLLLIAAVCFAGSRAAEVSVYERAKVWLKSHQEPQESDLDVLKQQDPKTFNAVRALLNRQALGTLEQHSARGPAKLSQQALDQFKYSKATEDRRQVLALEAKMFAEKQNWAKMEESKQTRLSKRLTSDEQKPKPKPAAAAKTAFRKPAPAAAPAEELEDVIPVAPRRRLSNLATHTSESWGDLKKLAHATKKAKTAGKKYVAPEPRRPSQSWAALMKNWQTRKQEEITGKGSALAGFSWGNDEAAAEPEEHKTLSALSSSQVRLPAEVEMPDQLKDWMTTGKKKSEEQQPEAQSLAPAQDAGNPYSMDLN